MRTAHKNYAWLGNEVARVRDTAKATAGKRGGKN
jgi:hypothetical protein